MERFSATATEVGVGGKEGVIGRDAGGAKRIKGGEAMVERANDLAAKKKGKGKSEPYLMIKESAPSLYKENHPKKVTGNIDFVLGMRLQKNISASCSSAVDRRITVVTTKQRP